MTYAQLTELVNSLERVVKKRRGEHAQVSGWLAALKRARNAQLRAEVNRVAKEASLRSTGRLRTV